jgi:hypothetical protein
VMATVRPWGLNAIWELVAMSDSLCSDGCLICAHHSSSVHGSADGLHALVLVVVVITGGDNVAVERTANLLAVLHDGRAGTHLYTTVLDYLDAVNNLNFLKRHFDLQSKPVSGHPGQHVLS